MESIEGKIRLIFTLDLINFKNIILVTTTPTTTNIETTTIYDTNLTRIKDQTDSTITIDYIETTTLSTTATIDATHLNLPNNLRTHFFN